MSLKSFFFSLLLVTLGTALVLGGIYYYAPQAKEHGMFSMASLLFFMVICIGLYFAGSSSARSKNKYAFTNLVSVSVFGKMVVAIGFLLLYQKVSNPQNQWFVGIFLFCYMIYTIFEVWFMSKLARS
ncbi:MAG: hypothetical protein R3A50_11570 [Saprospiraceae bacterium]|nr:hypothetical protein [Lewinellaceae bacterium]